MEKEALILRARAELAKLNAYYAADDAVRRSLSEQASALEAHAGQLEDVLDGWPQFRSLAR
jgi:hypothetical protein